MADLRAPSITEVMSQILDDHSAQIIVCMPGKVKDFDKADHIAEVEVMTLKPNGDPRPVVPRAPVVFPGVFWDVQDGETGLLVVADEDWRNWWRTGEQSMPESRASHQLANSFFIPGVASYTDLFFIPANSRCMTRPVAGGTVRLGIATATKAALHEDLLSDLNSFLQLLDIWGTTAHADWTAAATAFSSNVSPSITTLVTGIGAGSYKSPSVKVED